MIFLKKTFISDDEMCFARVIQKTHENKESSLSDYNRKNSLLIAVRLFYCLLHKTNLICIRNLNKGKILWLIFLLTSHIGKSIISLLLRNFQIDYKDTQKYQNIHISNHQTINIWSLISIILSVILTDFINLRQNNQIF